MKTIHNREWFSLAALSHHEASKTTDSNESLVEEYLAWKKSYSKSAHRAYRLWVTRFQQFANKPPEHLRLTDYNQFAGLLRDKYASRCIEFALNVVHNYLRYFAEQGRLRFPMFLIRVPKGISQTHPAISEGDYRQLTDTMRQITPKPIRDLAIIQLLHDTGMRIGELLRLEIDDIEEDKSAVIQTEKTKGFRRVYWNADTENTLHDLLVYRINFGPKESNRLFVTARTNSSESLCVRSVQRMLKRYLSQAGLKRHFCLHSFRHSFIHRLAKLGVPDAIIAQLVGHSTPLTISHYTKLSRPEFQHFAERQLAYASNDLPEQNLAAFPLAA